MLSGVGLVPVDCVLDRSLLHVPRAAAGSQPAAYLLHHPAGAGNDHGEKHAQHINPFCHEITKALIQNVDFTVAKSLIPYANSDCTADSEGRVYVVIKDTSVEK